MTRSIMSIVSERYLQRTVSMGAKFGCVPFHWSSDLKQLKRRRGRLAAFTRILNTVNTLALPVYLMGRYAHWKIYHDANNPEQRRSGMVILFAMIMFLHGATTMLHMQAYNEEHFGFVQMIMTFFKSVKEKYKVKGTNDGCEEYLRGFSFGMRLNLVGFGAVLFFKPQRVHTFMSIFSQPHKQPFFLPVTLANYSFVILCVIMSHYGVVIPIVYIFAMYTTIDMLKCAIAGRNISSREFTHIYRSAQLLQRNFNALFGSWLLPIHENLLIAGSVMGIYGMERMSGPLRGVWGVLMLLDIFHLSFLYNKMGQVYEESKNLLDAAGNVSRNNRWLRRFIASCKPITVTHGSMFFVDRGLVLTIWSTIACSAINLLVTVQ